MTAILLALALVSAASPALKGPPEFPEDLGPAQIDVSMYPLEHQRTYQEIFLPVYSLLKGGPARVINSPIIEIDPAREQSERQKYPELYADASLIRPTRDGWRMEVVRVKTRPPCCGACPVLTRQDSQALWHFLVYDSLRRKSGTAVPAWMAHRRELLRRFVSLKQETKT